MSSEGSKGNSHWPKSEASVHELMQNMRRARRGQKARESYYYWVEPGSCRSLTAENKKYPLAQFYSKRLSLMNH